MKLLNLGAGDSPLEGYINVDVSPGEGIDQIVDLIKFPWPWKDNSIDGVYMSHVLEHFLDQEKIAGEVYRILKPGGFWHIIAPHCTCLKGGMGIMTHYHAYAANTFFLHFSKVGVNNRCYFKGIRFETEYYYINWLNQSYKRQDYDFLPNWVFKYILPVISGIVNKLINKSHRWFERLWWPLVGGAAEVVYRGRKI